MASRPKDGTYQGMNWIRKEKRLAIYLRDGLACAYCGFALEDGAELSLDHIIPFSHGGSNKEDNLVTCCKKCNSSRGTRSVETFAASVAEYVNHGVTANEIIAHISDCLARKLNVKEAKAIIERRGGYANAMKNL